MRGTDSIKLNRKAIPQITIHRLSICHRCLESFAETEIGQKKDTISSSEISELTGIHPNQIRKDLAYFGEFGKRGIGYSVPDLISALKTILGSSKTWEIVLAGAGNLGEALLRYKGFQKHGFAITYVFDNDPHKIGQRINGTVIHPITSLKSIIQGRNIKLGIITVPAQNAQEVANHMIAGGIKSILNFAPTTLKGPLDVRLDTIDISIELERLVYFMTS